MGKFLDVLSKVGGAINPIIGAGLSIFNSLSNRSQQKKANQDEKQFALDMYNRQRQDALADMQMQNAYNTPAAQMQRYKDAGLNPNLIYGQTPAASAAVRSSSPGSYTPKVAPMQIAADLSQYQDTALKQAQTDNLKAQTVIAEKTIALKALELVGKDISNKTAGLNLSQKQELNDTYLETQRQLLQKIIADIGKTEATTAYTLSENERREALTSANLYQAAERILTMRKQRAKTDKDMQLIDQQIKNLKKDGTLKDLDINLKKQGIQPGDPLYMRVLAQYIDDLKNGKIGSTVGKAIGTPAPDKAPFMNPLRHIFGN